MLFFYTYISFTMITAANLVKFRNAILFPYLSAMKFISNSLFYCTN